MTGKTNTEKGLKYDLLESYRTNDTIAESSIKRKLVELLKEKKKSGFQNAENTFTTCKDTNHFAPSHIFIPDGKKYVHVCPSCGKEQTLVSPQVSF